MHDYEDADVCNQMKSKNMSLAAQGATAGSERCQTLREISEQMDSLLDGQSSQRIVPDEPCLLAKGQISVTTGSFSLTVTLGDKLLTHSNTLNFTHQHLPLSIRFLRVGHRTEAHPQHHLEEHPTHRIIKSSLFQRELTDQEKKSAPFI